jgi:putative transposase
MSWSARKKYRFVVIGYVVMPEHFHLLITEPEVRDPSVVMKVVKERFTKLLHHGGVRTRPIWQKRFYDFNVCSTEKRIEKLRYLHRNPVKRGLVKAPEEWKWSSFRTYIYGEEGLVKVNRQEWPLRMKYSASRHPRGLKPVLNEAPSARLKSCPDTELKPLSRMSRSPVL